VSLKYGAGLAPAMTGIEARMFCATGERHKAFRLQNPKTQPTRAELRGDDICDACGITVRSSAPVRPARHRARFAGGAAMNAPSGQMNLTEPIEIGKFWKNQFRQTLRYEPAA
jgi:hypothetical protein